ncbi:DNA-binding transcriptional response regulator, NtrC family, contains REC, AAA-type ATPase, and a Fis-type DNA-binding domains [Chitinophaga jiangningensis]|uniref:DNA-binding transcriptional response regulator, NtrC family, contains REC, AAA-type ATPase, and a Fis-type DNA-binding domains n=1 Tax=Chitinophaga jiangningensis TaxID=1419482 RepID=A0A1M7CHE2_9BACT|nr:sigma-54 dependent transcriptional regulator [Chitinophaga jiangningensis]SHL66604.1 DNA-binding transcriptional response regulator, NtrC family, contains REC, AAA-type ATPase, and a Fis-type DNA-binding domains [Chitinophaga jiangningensis]
MMHSILIVEDELVVAGDIRQSLEAAGYHVVGVARTVLRALEIMERCRPDMVVLDIFLKGDQTGIDLAAILNERNIPFVYLSANADEQILAAARVTRPFGFLVKPFREKDLLVTLDIAWYRNQCNEAIDAAGKNGRPPSAAALTSPDKNNFQGIIGQTPAMQEIFEQIDVVAPLDTSVLIMGESGTGKEGVATAVHRLSNRANGPFVKVNSAALPANLVESELFGHEKGAFTGALERRIGKFEQAHGGTLFLDEIGEMPMETQVRLLRVLQEKEIERIGGKGPIKIDVRIIAATNRNLEKAIALGRFRLDLYYRLNVFPVTLPSLRERKSDIPLLATHFCKYYAQKAGKLITGFSARAMNQLVEYPWPGNVRELQHFVERTVLLSQSAVLDAVPGPCRPEGATTTASAEPAVKTFAEMERDYILAMLRRCNNRVAGPGGAAELMDIPPSTLNSRMKKLGIAKVFRGY